MKQFKKIFFAMFIFIATTIVVGRKFVIIVVAQDNPMCGDVSARIDEDIRCRIEIDNSKFDNLTSAHLNINIPNDVIFTVIDTDWVCSSQIANVSCDKLYNVSFPKNTFDYVNVEFGSQKTGKYIIESTVDGEGTNDIEIKYTDAAYIDFETMWCGDGECNGPETVMTCASDCEGFCGDGFCDTESGEHVWNCAADCAVCGDGECTGSETVSSCAADCAICGDGECTGSETIFTCENDCSVCGDGECSGFEDWETCATDCGW